MPDNPNPAPEEARESALNRALNRVSAESLSHEDWPDENTIIAFIHGDATVDQRDEMEEALASSSAFRRFVVDLAGVLNESASAESQKAFDRIRVPTLSRVRQQYQSVPRANAWSLSGLLRPRILAPVILTAAVVIVLLQLDWFGPKGDAGIAHLEEHSQLDPSVFASFSTRGTSGAASRLYFQSPDSAAIDAFRQVLSFDWMTGRLEIATPADSLPVKRQIQVRILDSTSRQTGRVMLALPVDWDTQPEVGAEPEFWVFELDRRALSRVKIDANSSDVAVTASGTGVSLATATIRTPDGYRATTAQRVQINP